MARQSTFKTSQLCPSAKAFGLYGALLTACLASACGENTERVISKIPNSASVAASGGAGGVSASSTGGSAIVTSGGVATGGSTGTNSGGAGGAATGGSETLNTGGAATGGTSAIATGPSMSAAGAPVGFAAAGTGGTTGGGTQPSLLIQNCDQLTEALYSSTDYPAVLVIEAGKTIDCTVPVVADCATAPDNTTGCTNTCVIACDSTTGDTTRMTYRPLPGNYTDCSGLKGSNSSYTATTPMQKMRRNESTLFVSSNRTLIGLDANSTIRGANLYFPSQTTNVIIQNLNFVDVNPALIEAGDAITIDGANHIWIDHCRFSNISDGDIDSMGGTYVTYSWNHFVGLNNYACGGKHNSASSLSESSTVTAHHNYFDNTLGCGPKVTDTSIAHIFNNLWQSTAYYSIQVANTAQATIQNNYFSDSKKPYYGSDSCLTKSPACGISAAGNAFDGISTTETQDNGGTVAALPYTAFTLDNASAAAFKDSVAQAAGPTLTYP